MSLEERASNTINLIVGDSSLTDDLNDQEAIILINWGERLALRLSQRTAGMDDASANTFLDTAAQQVRTLIRRINKLVGELSPQIPAEMIEARLPGMFEAASELPVLHPENPEIHSFAAGLQRMNRQEAIQTLLSTVDPEDLSL